MIQDHDKGRLFCENLLNDAPFPDFPFKDPSWIGLVFNRDLHGISGLPYDVFEAILNSVKALGEDRLTFVPAVTPLSGSDKEFPSAEVADWHEYIRFLKSMDFCPEYYLVSDRGSVLFWFDPDTVVIGGVAEVIQSAARCLGGMDGLMVRSADAFGVSLGDSRSDVAVYIKNLGHAPG